MTKEELQEKITILRQEENAIELQISQMYEDRSRNHDAQRKIYQEYIDEHFPYKVGDELVLEFVNGDGDLVNRDITITKIDGYMCKLSNIILYYSYQNNKTGRLDYVGINGCALSAILRKKDNN